MDATTDRRIALAILQRYHELIYGDAINQARERRRRERLAVADNRHERRKQAAIRRKTNPAST